MAAALVFDLKPDDQLPREEAPYIVGRSISISASIDPTGDNGVIVAHGGTQHGVALYLKAGHLVMATRHSGKLTTVESPATLAHKQTQVAATLSKTGDIRLMINGAEVATGKAPGPIETMPVDGLQVGRDAAGAVGEYKGQNRFKGTISKLRIELAD